MSNSVPPMLDGAKIPPRMLSCDCPQCNQPIEFDAAGIKGDEIVAVECQYCHNETPVKVPLTDAEIAAAKAEAERAEAERLLNQQITQIKDTMRARLQGGKPVFLYDSIFIPVDSVLKEESLADDFDLALLRQLGLSGWDVVQAVPKTIGIALENETYSSSMPLGSVTWGGGIGGNVMGVHVIIKKSLSFGDLTDEPNDEVGQFIQSHLEDFLPQ